MDPIVGFWLLQPGSQSCPCTNRKVEGCRAVWLASPRWPWVDVEKGALLPKNRVLFIGDIGLREDADQIKQSTVSIFILLFDAGGRIAPIYNAMGPPGLLKVKATPRSHYKPTLRSLRTTEFTVPSWEMLWGTFQGTLQVTTSLSSGQA